MRIERVVAVLAGLVLAGAGAVMMRAVGDWQFQLLVAPPMLTGLGAVGLAAARRPTAQRAWSIAIEVVVILGAIMWGALGLLFVLPAIIMGGLASAFVGIARAGRDAVRPASTLVATGALWSLLFGVGGFLGKMPASVHVALAASLVLGLAGLAWVCAIEDTYAGPVLMPRAVARP
jgi:hypothetical protein